MTSMVSHSIPRQRTVGANAKIVESELMQKIAQGKNTYYGYIEEIWDVNYEMSLQNPVFKCQWVKHPRGIEVDEYEFIIVDLGNVGHKDEPWVLASTVAQIFYILDLKDEKKHIVIPSKQ
jgi:hypothetical protein